LPETRQTKQVNFFFSFFFSFTGSLTPGTINLSAVQLGLDKKVTIAWRLALAAASIEYLYAWLAVKFEVYITSAPLVFKHFQLIAAIVMLTLGFLTFRAASRPSKFTQQFYNSGFRRGLALGILNPLAMPYWLGITAYLKSQHWINLSTNFQLHSYLAGVSLGVFTLLVSVAYMANKVVSVLQHKTALLKKIPAFIMMALGVFALARYFIT
jgi:threonine/homoserine/homoserine lactone efflux protein